MPVRLGMDLVKDKPGHIQSVLCTYFRGKHLVKSRILVIHDPFGRRHDLRTFHQGRRHINHLLSHIKDNTGLLAVCRRSINLCGRLTVCIQEIECDSSSQLAVMRRDHGSPCKVLVAWAVHLDALHFYRMI